MNLYPLPTPKDDNKVIVGKNERFCAGGRVYSTISLPPQYFCKYNNQSWVEQKISDVSWRCINNNKPALKVAPSAACRWSRSA